MKINAFFLFLLFLCITAIGMDQSGLFILTIFKDVYCKNIDEYVVASKENATKIIYIPVHSYIEQNTLSYNQEILFSENINIMRLLLQINKYFCKKITPFYKNALFQYNIAFTDNYFFINFNQYFKIMYQKALNGSTVDNYYIELIAKHIGTNHNSNLIIMNIFRELLISNYIRKIYQPSIFNIKQTRLLEQLIKNDIYPIVYLLKRALYFKYPDQIILLFKNPIIIPDYLQTISLKYDIHISDNMLVVNQKENFHKVVLKKIDQDADDFGTNPYACTIL